MNINLNYFILILLVSISAYSQIIDENESPKTAINDASWLSGYWQGKGLGGITEEIWSKPSAGSMVGVFKLVVNNKIKFYEIITLYEENNSLLMRIKHFTNDLIAWEEKDETVDFKLVKAEKNKLIFDGLTLEKVSEYEMNVYLILEGKEVKLNYKKI